jgi:hypothetical protein
MTVALRICARLSRFAVGMSKIGGVLTRVDLPADPKCARTVAASSLFAAVDSSAIMWFEAQGGNVLLRASSLPLKKRI